MNKLKTILPASLMIFIVVPVCAYLLESARFAEDDTPAFIGFGLIVAGGLLSAILHKCGLLNLIPLAVNSVGLGFCLRAWYIFRGFSNSLPVLLAACLIAWAFIPLFWLWSRIPIFDRHPALMSFIFIAPVTAVYCVLIFNTETTWLSTTGFCLIVAATVRHRTENPAKRGSDPFPRVFFAAIRIFFKKLLTCAPLCGIIQNVVIWVWRSW